MKSLEEHLSKACPAIVGWHKLVWEKTLSEDAEVLIEEVIEEKPIITEWRTIHGERKIDNDFAKNMTVGY